MQTLTDPELINHTTLAWKPLPNEGVVLNGARLHLVFWDKKSWNPPVKPDITPSTIKDALGKIVEYVSDALKEYNINPITPDEQESYTGDWQGDLKIKDIVQAIEGLVKSPGPELPNATDGNRLYVVIMPPGIRPSDPKLAGVNGEHDSGGNPKVHYAWVTWSKFDDLTASLSHELIEACTNPEPPHGWTFAKEEICDVCHYAGQYKGIQVAAYAKPDGSVHVPPRAKLSAAAGDCA